MSITPSQSDYPALQLRVHSPPSGTSLQTTRDQPPHQSSGSVTPSSAAYYPETDDDDQNTHHGGTPGARRETRPGQDVLDGVSNASSRRGSGQVQDFGLGWNPSEQRDGKRRTSGQTEGFFGRRKPSDQADNMVPAGSEVPHPPQQPYALKRGPNDQSESFASAGSHSMPQQPLAVKRRPSEQAESFVSVGSGTAPQQPYALKRGPNDQSESFASAGSHSTPQQPLAVKRRPSEQAESFASVGSRSTPQQQPPPPQQPEPARQPERDEGPDGWSPREQREQFKTAPRGDSYAAPSEADGEPDRYKLSRRQLKAPTAAAAPSFAQPDPPPDTRSAAIANFYTRLRKTMQAANKRRPAPSNSMAVRAPQTPFALAAWRLWCADLVHFGEKDPSANTVAAQLAAAGESGSGAQQQRRPIITAAIDTSPASLEDARAYESFTPPDLDTLSATDLMEEGEEADGTSPVKGEDGEVVMFLATKREDVLTRSEFLAAMDGDFADQVFVVGRPLQLDLYTDPVTRFVVQAASAETSVPLPPGSPQRRQTVVAIRSPSAAMVVTPESVQRRMSAVPEQALRYQEASAIMPSSFPNHSRRIPVLWPPPGITRENEMLCVSSPFNSPLSTSTGGWTASWAASTNSTTPRHRNKNLVGARSPSHSPSKEKRSARIGALMFHEGVEPQKAESTGEGEEYAAVAPTPACHVTWRHQNGRSHDSSATGDMSTGMEEGGDEASGGAPQDGLVSYLPPFLEGAAQRLPLHLAPTSSPSFVQTDAGFVEKVLSRLPRLQSLVLCDTTLPYIRSQAVRHASAIVRRTPFHHLRELYLLGCSFTVPREDHTSSPRNRHNHNSSSTRTSVSHVSNPRVSPRKRSTVIDDGGNNIHSGHQEWQAGDAHRRSSASSALPAILSPSHSVMYDLRGEETAAQELARRVRIGERRLLAMVEGRRRSTVVAEDYSAVSYMDGQQPGLQWISQAGELERLHLDRCPIQAQELASVMQCLPHLRFLSATHTDIRRLHWLACIPQLTDLNLSHSPWLLDASPLEHLTSLRHLSLSFTPLRSIEALSACTALESVHLLCCRWLRKGFQSLQQLTHLKVLNVSRTNAQQLDWLSGMHSTQLECLDVSYCLQVEDPASAIEVIGRFHQLHYLNISGMVTHVTSAATTSQSRLYDNCEPASLQWLSSCTALRELWCADVGCPLTDFKFIHSLANNLELLHLTGCAQMTDTYWLQECERLRFLNLASNPFLHDLEGLHSLHYLEHLSLEGSSVSDEGLSTMLNAGCGECLVALNVARCGQLRDFSFLSRLRALRQLYLGYTAIQSLEPVTGCERLEHIEATDCPLLRDATPLKHLSRLRHVRLDFVPITSLSWVLELPQLEYLNISGCTNCDDYATIGRIKSKAFYFLDISHTAVTSDDWMSDLTRLQILRMRYCSGVLHLQTVRELSALRELDLQGSGLLINPMLVRELSVWAAKSGVVLSMKGDDDPGFMTELSPSGGASSRRATLQCASGAFNNSSHTNNDRSSTNHQSSSKRNSRSLSLGKSISDVEIDDGRSNVEGSSRLAANSARETLVLPPLK